MRGPPPALAAGATGRGAGTTPPSAAGAVFGPGPPRGALRSAPPWAWPLLLVVGLGAGLFVPLLGISLVALLAADLAVAVVAQRRSARESAH